MTRRRGRPYVVACPRVDIDAEILRMGDDVAAMLTFRDPDGDRLVVVEQASPGPSA